LGQDEATVKEIRISGKSSAKAKMGEAISVALDREIDIQPGSTLTKSPIETHQQFEVDLVWLSTEKGTKGRRLILKSYGAKADAFITKISTIDLDSDEKSGQASSVEPNQIVRCNISLASLVPLTNFDEDNDLGKFILIDPYNGQTVAAGTVNHPLRRGDNLTKHEFEVTSSEFAELTGNKGQVIWFTGLSGSGKSTLANAVSVKLFEQGKPHFILDGDNLRLGINKDLGFTDQDRSENIRRTAEVAKLMADAGLIVLVSLVSPFNADRTTAKEIIGEDRFDLVFMNTPLEICEERDPKGLYEKARKGELPNLTGLGSPFELPDFSSLVLTNQLELDQMVDDVIQLHS
jgi:bifunctional enzyme CysN/CysC